jgi:hypothetical protein
VPGGGGDQDRDQDQAKGEGGFVHGDGRLAATTGRGRAFSGMAAIAWGRPKTPMARAMFFTDCSPRSVKAGQAVADLLVGGAREMQTPPGSHRASSRAATLTPSPKMSPPSMMMSPTLMREHDAAVIGDDGVEGEHGALDRDGGGDGIDHGGELDHQAVAGDGDDAAVVAGDGGVDPVAAVRFQGVEGAEFVGAHQLAVAGDIQRENGREPALDARGAHRPPPGGGRSAWAGRDAFGLHSLAK